MVLRAKKPTETPEKPCRLKLFIYGAAKIGKTTAALQFPHSYIIDSEGATEYRPYRQLMTASQSASVVIRNFDDLMENVRYLMTNKHEYKTLVIDSLSPLYMSIIEEAEKAVGNGFGRAHGEANKRFKNLMNLILAMDMNVIATAHVKTKYTVDVIGNPIQTFDCYDKMDYCFNTIMEIQERANKRYALVKGSWLENFKKGDNFEFSYDEITKRFPIESLEREVVIERLATMENIMELNRLIDILKIPILRQKTWLEKANVASFDEMKDEDVEKLIIGCQQVLEKQFKEKENV